MSNPNFQRSRLFPNPLSIECPWCKEDPERPCRRADGKLLGENRYHVSRIGMAKKQVSGR